MSQVYILLVQTNNKSKANTEIMYNTVHFISQILIYIKINGDNIKVIEIPENQKKTSKYQTLFKKYKIKDVDLPCLYIPYSENNKPVSVVGLKHIKYVFQDVIKDGQLKLKQGETSPDDGTLYNKTHEDMLREEMTPDKAESDKGKETRLNEDMREEEIQKQIMNYSKRTGNRHTEGNMQNNEITSKSTPIDKNLTRNTSDPPSRRPSNIQPDSTNKSQKNQKINNDDNDDEDFERMMRARGEYNFNDDKIH